MRIASFAYRAMRIARYLELLRTRRTGGLRRQIAHIRKLRIGQVPTAARR